MVGDDNVFINLACLLQVGDQPVQNSFFPNFQQWLGEVLSEWIKPCGVACGKNEAFHIARAKGRSSSQAKRASSSGTFFASEASQAPSGKFFRVAVAHRSGRAERKVYGLMLNVK